MKAVMITMIIEIQTLLLFISRAKIAARTENKK